MGDQRGAGVRRPLFRGAGVALLTLFDRGGRLLADETAAFAAALAERGAAAVLVAGTTGEFWTLNDDERCDLVAAVRAAVPPSVPVLAGVGALTERQTLRIAAAIRDSDANAAVCFVPRGAAPDGFYAKVREAIGELPLLGYHFPAAGYADLPVAQLADLPIDGLKDSSGEPNRLAQTAAVLPSGIYTGSALLATLAAALAIDGGLFALGNAEPALAQAAMRGDLAAQGRLAELHLQLADDVPPRAAKRLAAQRFGTPPWTRGVSLAEAWAAAG